MTNLTNCQTRRKQCVIESLPIIIKGFNLTKFLSNKHNILKSLSSTNNVKSTDMKSNGMSPWGFVATRERNTENQIIPEKTSHNKDRDYKFY